MAKTIPSFSSAQLTQLAHLLDGPTGSELDRMLREARIPIGEESTKWRRLRESFDLAQRQAGCANPAARFVKLALNPANFIGERQTLKGLRHDVNQVLGFSGLRNEDDGTLVLLEKPGLSPRPSSVRIASAHAWSSVGFTQTYSPTVALS
jgi:hypothetical protein